jgi:uncharacterized damage-inducible protein DinB
VNPTSPTSSETPTFNVSIRQEIINMPVAAELTTAASIYKQNEKMLSKSFEGLTREEWQSRPNATSNSLLWIAGHVVWSRSLALKFLGTTWSRPWLELFARGAKPASPAECPSPEEIVLAWNDAKAQLTTALDEASEEVLSSAAPEKSPSFDGKMSGMVSFLAFHEAYHVGQVAYLRCWLGHKGVAG